MSKKTSTFVQESKARETWIPAYEKRLREEQPERAPQESVASTAALVRGVLDAVEAPAAAEDASRTRALTEMREVGQPAPDRPVRAPWFLRVGRRLQTVFTLGKKR